MRAACDGLGVARLTRDGARRESAALPCIGRASLRRARLSGRRFRTRRSTVGRRLSAAVDAVDAGDRARGGPAPAAGRTRAPRTGAPLIIRRHRARLRIAALNGGRLREDAVVTVHGRGVRGVVVDVVAGDRGRLWRQRGKAQGQRTTALVRGKKRRSSQRSKKVCQAAADLRAASAGDGARPPRRVRVPLVVRAEARVARLRGGRNGAGTGAMTVVRVSHALRIGAGNRTSLRPAPARSTAATPGRIHVLPVLAHGGIARLAGGGHRARAILIAHAAGGPVLSLLTRHGLSLSATAA
jgi:hypothetical protein